MGMCLLIHAGISVKPYSKRGPSYLVRLRDGRLELNAFIHVFKERLIDVLIKTRNVHLPKSPQACFHGKAGIKNQCFGQYDVIECTIR